jgi:hypothetical protein
MSNDRAGDEYCIEKGCCLHSPSDLFVCVVFPSKGQVTRSVVVILKRIICSAKLCIRNMKNLHSKYEKFIVSMSSYSMLCYEPIIGCSDDRTGDPPAAGRRLWH